jgi:hypothetical protein
MAQGARGGAHRGGRRTVRQLQSAQVWVAPHCPPLRAPVGHANAESQPCDAAGGCYNGHGHLGHRWPRRAIPKRSGRRLHPRSQPAHSSRRAGPSAPATRRLSSCTQHIGTRRPACTDSASYVSSACLLSGTGSQFGTGVGEGQRAGQSTVAHPASRLQSHCRLCCVACSKSIACQICAPPGHGPKKATVRRIAAASAPADGLGEAWRPRDRRRRIPLLP